MSNSVDQRIVEMQFDNAQFEKGIAETLASLKGLEKSMTLKDGGSAIEAMNKSLAEIGVKVDGVSSKFSVMGVAAFTAVSRITESILDLGANIAREVTIQPLIDGLDEYHLKMNSIKTIQTNTMGKSSLEDINNALSDLNEYADKTIYNFAQMTHYVGTFTAAGVGLEQSKSAIQGIANVAAAAGADANAASRAMFNLSQSLAAGELKLIDWRSVLNAGMGGSFLKDELIATSRAFGTGVDAAIEKTGSFEESLKEGWATSEVLTQTLENFTYATKSMTAAEKEATTAKLKSLGYDDQQIKTIYDKANAAQEAATKVRTAQQLIDTTKEALGSGWAQTWEYIIGDLQEAEEFFTAISGLLNGVIDAVSDARNKFFESWHDAGGRDAMVDSIVTFAKSLEHPFKALKGAVESVLEPFSGENLAEMFKGFKKFVDETAAAFNGNYSKDHNPFGLAFRTVRRFLQADLTVITAMIETAMKAIPPIVGGAASAVSNIVMEVLLFVRDSAKALADFGSTVVGPALEALFSPIANILDSVGLSAVTKFFSGFAKSIEGFLRVIWHQGTKKTGFLGKDTLAGGLKQMMDAIVDIASKIGGALKFIGDVIASFMEGVREVIRDHMQPLSDALAKFGDVVIGPAMQAVGSVLESIGGAVSEFVSSVTVGDNAPEFIKGLAGGIKELVDAASSGDFSNVFKAITDFAKDTAIKGVEALANGISALADGIADFAAGPGAAIFEALGNAFTFVGGVVLTVKDWIVNAWQVISKAFGDAGFSIEPVIEFFKGLADAVGSFIESITKNGFNFDTILDLFKGIADSAGNLVDDVVPKLSSAFGDIGKSIYDNLEGPLKDLWDWVTNITNPLDTLSKNFSDNMGKIAGVFGGGIFPGAEKAEAVEGGFDAIAGIDTGAVVDEGFNFITALDNIAKAMANPIGTIKGWVKGGLGKISENINQVLDGVFGWDKWSQVEEFGKKMLGLGASGGAVYAIYQFGEALRNAGEMFKAIKDVPKAIAGVANGLTNVTKAIEGSIKTKAILNIAIAVGILVGSLVALSMSDLDKAKEALPLVLTLLAGVSLIVMAFGKLAGMDGFEMAGITVFSNSMLALAVAIGVMALVVSMLGAIPPAQLQQGERVMMEFGLIMAAITFVMSKVPTGIASMAGTFIGLAVLVGVLAGVAILLGSIPDDAFNKGAAALVGMAVGIAMLVAIVGRFGPAVAEGAAGLLTIAGSVAILAGAMFVLGQLDEGQLLKGGGAVIALVGVMVGVIAAFKKIKPGFLVITIKAMMSFAAAIAILAGCIAGLAMIGMLGGDLMGATIAVGALVGMMALLALAVGKSGGFGSATAGAIIAMAVVIGVLSAALISLSLIPFSSLGMALFALCVALAALCGAFYAFGALAPTMMEGIVALQAMIVVVIVLTAVLAALSYVAQEGDLVGALAGLAIGLVIFIAALALLGALGLTPIAEGLIMMGFALEALVAPLVTVATAIAIFAAAALIFVVALKVFSTMTPEAIDSVIEAVKRLCDGLVELIPYISKGVMAIGFAIVTGLIGLIPGIAMAIGMFILEILRALEILAPQIIDALFDLGAALVKALGEGIKEHGGEILDVLGQLGLAILEAVMNIFKPFNEAYTDWMYDVAKMNNDEATMAAIDAARNQGKQISEARSEGAREGNTMAEDAVSEEQKMFDEMNRIKEEYGFSTGHGITNSVSEGAKEGAKGFNFLESLGLDSSALGMSISEVTSKVQGMGGDIPQILQEMLQSGMGNVSLAQITDENGVFDPAAMEQLGANAGEAGGEGYYYGVKTSVESKDIAGVIVNPDTIDQGAVEEAFANVGEGAANAFSDSFTESIANVDGSGPVQKAADSMKMESKFQEAGKVDGQAATKGMEAGLKDMSSKVKSAASNASRTVKNQSGSMRSAGSETGRAVVSGMVSGMNSQIPSLEKTVARICALAEKAAKAKLEINSPSKVFARIGSGIIEGMVLGIESMQSDLKATMGETGDIASGGLKLQSSAVDELLSGMPDQPVIRPVLDLTDYEYGLRQMYGMSTYMPMVGAQLVGRAVSASPVGQAAAGGNVIQIELNYSADADANQIVMDIANGLSQKLMMEGS